MMLNFPNGDGNPVKISQEGQNNFAGFTSTWGKVNCPKRNILW